MKNLRSTKELTGYAVQAADGDIGKVRELYFDDTDWRVKHLIVTTGRWLPGNRILLPPAAVGFIEWDRRKIFVGFTREQVRGHPGARTDMPVAEQRKAEQRARRNWALYLAGEALASDPEAVQAPGFAPFNDDGTSFDPHLRTTRVVTGLTLRAPDGPVGRIVDLIIDEGTWDIRYLVVRRRDGSRLALPPRLLKDIRIEDRVATTDLPARDVVSGPALDPSTLFTCRYQEAVRSHFPRDDRAPSCL